MDCNQSSFLGLPKEKMWLGTAFLEFRSFHEQRCFKYIWLSKIFNKKINKDILLNVDQLNVNSYFISKVETFVFTDNLLITTLFLIT